MEHILHGLMICADTILTILVRKPLKHIKVLGALVLPIALFFFITTLPYNPFQWILGQAVVHEKLWAQFLAYFFLDGLAPLYFLFAAVVSMIHMLNQLAGANKSLAQDFTKALRFMKRTWYVWTALLAGVYALKYSSLILPGFLDTISPLLKGGFLFVALMSFAPFVITSRPLNALQNSFELFKKDPLLSLALGVAGLLVTAFATYLANAFFEMIIRVTANAPPKVQMLINAGAMDVLYMFLFSLVSVSAYKFLNSWHS